VKTILLIFLLSISLIALDKEVPKVQNTKQELSYIIDAKNYGLIDAKKAFFVVNSHKYGTMQDYFAFAEEKDAKEHVEKYGGSVVDYETYMKFDDNGTK
jgi:nitrous oxide reductase accessory protein NosL